MTQAPQARSEVGTRQTAADGPEAESPAHSDPAVDEAVTVISMVPAPDPTEESDQPRATAPPDETVASQGTVPSEETVPSDETLATEETGAPEETGSTGITQVFDPQAAGDDAAGQARALTVVPGSDLNGSGLDGSDLNDRDLNDRDLKNSDLKNSDLAVDDRTSSDQVAPASRPDFVHPEPTFNIGNPFPIVTVPPFTPPPFTPPPFVPTATTLPPVSSWGVPSADPAPSVEPMPASLVEPRPPTGDESEGRQFAGDHDGLTQLAEDLPSDYRPPPVPPAPGPGQVYASVCPAGHANAPHAGNCRVCVAPILNAPPSLAPRPLLGRIRLSTGPVFDIDPCVVVGRAPSVSRVASRDLPKLVTVPSPNQDISRSHVEIRAQDWQLVVTDLNSTNGTVVRAPNRPEQMLHPGQSLVVELGWRVELGDGIEFLVEGAP